MPPAGILIPMNLSKSSLLILVLVSFALSRGVFFLINDPEGPNLLIVTVLATGFFLFFVGLTYVFKKKSL